MKKILSKLLLSFTMLSVLLSSCSTETPSSQSNEFSNNSESENVSFEHSGEEIPPSKDSSEESDVSNISNVESEISDGSNKENVSSDSSKEEISSSKDSEFENDINSSSKDETDSNLSGDLTYKVSYKDTDKTTAYDKNSSTSISCSQNTVDIHGEGATFSNNTLTISKGGVYVLKGELNGRIVVNSTDSTPVRLILCGLNVKCETSSPIYVISADKVILTLEENTTNVFKDGQEFVYDDATNEEPSATIFSKDDLTINGKGTLLVEAVFKNGIQCKDKLKICGGTISVTSKNDGIKGKDCVGIMGGTITVNSQGDGIQSSNADLGNVGFVNISGGNIKINATLDGIQGENGVCISGGTVQINTQGGSASSSESKKGIKGTKNITITGGTINITSTDDGIHSDGNIIVEGGEIAVSSGDDGFHAETEISIKNGTVNIVRSYEGLEGAKINIYGGSVYITSSDDGINGSDGTGGKGGFGGGMSANSNCEFNVSGGLLYVNAQGDGLDSNGNIIISGGVVLCEGPTNGGNSSIDHNGSIIIKGGILLSLGSSGMANEALSSANGSTQCAFAAFCNGSAGTTIAIKDSSKKVLLVFKTSKQFGHVVFSSPNVKVGETYEIWAGGNGSGENEKGLYKNNEYNGGSILASVTQSTTITNSGSGNFPGGGFPGNGGGGTRPPKPNRW